jgi:hypothetical protein
MNVVRQTQQAGFKMMVVTSSFGCLLSRTYQFFWRWCFCLIDEFLLYCSNTPGFRGLTFNYFSILLFLLTRTSTDWGTADDEEFPKNKEGKYFIYSIAKIKPERSLWEFVKDHPELEVATSKLFEPNSSDIRVSQTPFQFCEVMPSAYMQRRSYCPHPWALTTSSTSSSISAPHPSHRTGLSTGAPSLAGMSLRLLCT